MHMIKKLKRTIVFILKIALFASLFGIFFGIFGINNPWLFNFSRTTGVTMVTFVVLGIALMSVYGGYAVGSQKSRPIVHSMALATVITDLVTHLQLSIMNTSEKNNDHFVYETPHLLLLVMVLQVLVIIFFAYFGNYVYFSIEPPERCCVISSSSQSLGHIIPKILRFKKQYEIDEIVRYDAQNVLDVISRSDTIFLYDVPTKERTDLIDFCYQKQKNIYYNFEMIDVVSQGAKYVTLDDKSMVMHMAKDLTFEQRVIKRLMDLSISIVALILTSPIMLACAIAIKAEDGGKVFYKQKRLTKYGRVFEVYKFRTMKEENSIHKSVTADDDRITRVGRVLRKFRVDELPQLLNILKGDMTVEYCNGYVEDKDAAFERIRQAEPDLVLVALGAPAQERLIARHLEEFGKGVFIGVGGSFDVLSGSKRRAPAVFVRTNTEWLYRILREPSRLGRFYRNNVKFLGEVKKAAKAARQG